jgi:hypothetical protein
MRREDAVEHLVDERLGFVEDLLHGGLALPRRLL